METRVIYSAAANSLDSWDMENLKYLRKISRSNQATNGGTDHAETDSYNSNDSGTLVSDEEFLHPENENENSLSACTDYSGQTIVSVSSHGASKSIVAPLDSCYVLDIVTVRNESVLANRINIPKSKPLLGSDGYESSSTGSSIDERNFFDRDPDPDVDPESYSDFGGYKSSSLSTIVQREQSPRRRSSSACPYCDNGNIPISRQSSPYFYLGQPKNKFEETSMVPTVGDECPPEMPRSPSPYYVRLRRDLYNLPASYSPLIKSPSNFGMDQQGQLLIDYSPNWDGLETYIKNLKL